MMRKSQSCEIWSRSKNRLDKRKALRLGQPRGSEGVETGSAVSDQITLAQVDHCEFRGYYSKHTGVCKPTHEAN